VASYADSRLVSLHAVEKKASYLNGKYINSSIHARRY
jgi:hypothetical protein